MREVYRSLAGSTEIELVIEADVIKPPSVRVIRADDDGPEPLLPEATN